MPYILPVPVWALGQRGVLDNFEWMVTIHNLETVSSHLENANSP